MPPLVIFLFSDGPPSNLILLKSLVWVYPLYPVSPLFLCSPFLFLTLFAGCLKLLFRTIPPLALALCLSYEGVIFILLFSLVASFLCLWTNSLIPFSFVAIFCACSRFVFPTLACALFFFRRFLPLNLFTSHPPFFGFSLVASPPIPSLVLSHCPFCSFLFLGLAYFCLDVEAVWRDSLVFFLFCR